MRIAISLLTGLNVLIFATRAFAAPAQDPIVCVAKKSGTVTVKSKCKKSELRFAESSYSEGRLTIMNIAPTGAKFSTIGAAVAAASARELSATNPILLRVAPGQYAVQSELTLPSFVTLEGAGAGASVVTLSGDGIIRMSSSSVLRRLTVTVSGAISNSIAVDVSSNRSDVTIEDVAFGSPVSASNLSMIYTAGTNVVLQRLTFKNVAPGTSLFAIFVGGGSALIEGVRMDLDSNATGIGVGGGAASIRNTTIVGRKVDQGDSIVGIRSFNSGVTMTVDNSSVVIAGDSFAGTSALWATTGSRITARHSVFSLTGSHAGAIQADEGGTVEVLDSDIVTDGSSPTSGAYSGGTLSIGGSRLRGGAVVAQTGGTTRCAAVYDEDFTFSASACP